MRTGTVATLFMSCLALVHQPLQAFQDKAPNPAATVSAFYTWYLDQLVHDRDPLTQDKGSVKKFVSSFLIADIQKRADTGAALDSDYFLKAQDYLDDWPKNVHVELSQSDRTRGSVVVTLGKEEPWRLRVGLVRQFGLWKIIKVARIR